MSGAQFGWLEAIAIATIFSLVGLQRGAELLPDRSGEKVVFRGRRLR